MERLKKRKEVSLVWILVRYVLQIVFGCAFIILVAVLLLIMPQIPGWTRPANYVEKELQKWESEFEGQKEGTYESLPEGVEAIVYDLSGKVIAANVEQEALERLQRIRNLYGETSQFILGRDVYRTMLTKTGSIFLHYEMKVRFESILMGMAVAAIFLFFLFHTLLTAKRLGKELKKLQGYATEIGRQNCLAISAEKTGVKEINQVMDALDFMRNTLKESMEEKWASEQTKRKNMAMLAHDLKTPLTIIHGNAELLAEAERTKEERAYVDSILKNAEEITRTVVQIVEKMES